MANNTITSIDSVYMLSVGGLYNTPVQLQGYMADRAFETDAVDIAELVMGVDGILSAGFVPYMLRQTVSIMPDSPSSEIFENWIEAERTNRVKLVAQGTIIIPSTSRQYTMTDGYLTSITAIPSANRVLQGRPFTITWNSISAAPL